MECHLKSIKQEHAQYNSQLNGRIVSFSFQGYQTLLAIGLFKRLTFDELIVELTEVDFK